MVKTIQVDSTEPSSEVLAVNLIIEVLENSIQHLTNNHELVALELLAVAQEGIEDLRRDIGRKQHLDQGSLPFEDYSQGDRTVASSDR